MRITASVSAIALALGVGLTVAMPAQANHHTKMDKLFHKADKDQDGTLDRKEAKKIPGLSKKFNKLDGDKDGTLTLDEINGTAKAAAKASEKPTMSAKSQPAAVVANNGKVTREQGEANFRKHDRDHDGTLDRNEANGLPRVAKYFDEIDADNTGTVSLKEIYDFSKARQLARAQTK